VLFKIRQGRISGDRLTIEASPREGAVLRFDLRVKGDVLEGTVEENGQTIGTARRKKRADRAGVSSLGRD
jgi:hypothetical protein